jgi:hypothetical protein
MLQDVFINTEFIFSYREYSVAIKPILHDCRHEISEMSSVFSQFHAFQALMSIYEIYVEICHSESSFQKLSHFITF